MTSKHKPAHEQNFEEAIAEYIERCHESVGKERDEGQPPGDGTPFLRNGPPFESVIRFNSDTVKRYALTVGDTNPLFVDPDYGKNTRYGSQIAPNPALIWARSPGGQGPTRPGGYPVGDFFSGLAWEFYSPVYVGNARYTTNKVTTEFFEKKGAQGRLLFLVEELNYWDAHRDLVGKCFGTLILVPIETMGASRTMDPTKLGEKLLYSRNASQYGPDDFTRIDGNLSTDMRRGANTRYWEDVEVGDKIGPMLFPPWSLYDQLGGGFGYQYIFGHGKSNGDDAAFEQAYQSIRGGGGYGAFPNPATRWPWGPNAEHEDALLAAYRGQALPFDGGQHRSQLPHRMISDWMGDDGWIRRYQVALRRPVYYSDATVYSGEVVKKFTEVQEGDHKAGGVPGKATYHAVGIKLEGANQVGQTQMQGAITVYLPSRKDGPVVLPVPHSGKPPYVPYEKFYRDWYQ